MPSRPHRILSLLFLSLAFVSRSSPAFAQRLQRPFIVSERVGPEIDQLERAYFNLFPCATGFISATFRPLNDSTFIVRIQRSGSASGEVTDSLGAGVVQELGKYLDNFERVYDNTRAVDWSRLIQVAMPVHRFREGIDLEVVRQDRTTASGRLLFADERGIVLGDYGSALQLDYSQAIFLAPHELTHVRDRWPAVRHLFQEINISGAGTDVNYSTYTLPRLQKFEAFRLVPSPELNRFIEAKRRTANASVGQEQEVDEAYLRRFVNRIHVQLSAHGVTLASAPGAYPMQLSGEDGQGKIQFTNATLSVQLDYTVARRLRLGVGASFSPGLAGASTFRDTVIFEDRKESIHMLNQYRKGTGIARVSTVSFAGLITYLIRPFDQIAFFRHPGIFRPIEIGVRAGPVLARTSVRSTVASADAFSLLNGYGVIHFGQSQREDRLLVGGTGAIEGDLYLTRHLSLGVDVRAEYFPGFGMHENALFGEAVGDDPVKVLPAVRKSLLRSFLSLGARFHF